MSASTRLSLQDCSISLRIPTPSPFISPIENPENQTLSTIRTASQLTEAFIGETVFLTVSINPPETSNTPEAVLRALETCGDVHVSLSPSEESPRSKKRLQNETCRLPVLKESRWFVAARDSDGVHVAYKGIWALIRTPPENSGGSRVPSISGKHDLVVSVRERGVMASAKNSPVWATIDRASRLFAKNMVLRASKPLLLSMPIEIIGEEQMVCGSADKALVSVSVRNCTSDANVSVVPPYINVGSSRVVGADGAEGRAIQLDEMYDFVSITETDIDDLGAAEDEDEGLLERTRSGASCEDYGLFIPSFTQLARRAATLGPREVYNFVFAVVQRGSGHGEGEGGTNVKRGEGLRLAVGEDVQTCVAVAWKCGKGDEIGVMGEESFHREMSAGGVLATGKRGNVAVHVTSVRWRPIGLVDGVVVSFSGPSVVEVGSKVNVSIRILNQTRRTLERISVEVQQDDGPRDLLALRTVIAVGDIGGGGETCLQLPCVALRVGTVGVGVVRIVEGEAGVVWASESELQVLVVEREEGDEECDGSIEVGRGVDDEVCVT